MDGEAGIRERYTRVAPVLDERGRRSVAAAEAIAVGWGGIMAAHRATGLARATIERGIRELTGMAPPAPWGGCVVQVAGARK